MTRAQPVLATTGRPELTGLESSVSRALAQMHRQLEDTDAAAVGYTPASATAWSGNAPATIAEALDRIAAALGPIP